MAGRLRSKSDLLIYCSPDASVRSRENDGVQLQQQHCVFYSTLLLSLRAVDLIPCYCYEREWSVADLTCRGVDGNRQRWGRRCLLGDGAIPPAGRRGTAVAAGRVGAPGGARAACLRRTAPPPAWRPRVPPVPLRWARAVRVFTVREVPPAVFFTLAVRRRRNVRGAHRTLVWPRGVGLYVPVHVVPVGFAPSPTKGTRPGSLSRAGQNPWRARVCHDSRRYRARCVVHRSQAGSRDEPSSRCGGA